MSYYDHATGKLVRVKHLGSTWLFGKQYLWQEIDGVATLQAYQRDPLGLGVLANPDTI